MRYNSRGLSIYGIAQKIKITPWEAKEIIEKEELKSSFLLHEELP